MHIDELPEKLLMHILSFLPSKQLCKKVALVCKKWRLLAYNGQLWKNLCLRPEYCRFSVAMETLVTLINLRFGNHLRSIELPCTLITIPVLHELSQKCSFLRGMTLDFAKATQLYDYTGLEVFPSNLRSLCICLSDVVFLEGFLRRVYSCLSSLQVLHLIGTIETTSDEEEIFEVVNIGKVRAHTPNLRVVNLYGVMFVDDSHLELIAGNCIHLETIAANYCLRVNGKSLKYIVQRCKKLRTLLLKHTSLTDENVMAVGWENSHIQEIDISCTDLCEGCLTDMFSRLPPLSFLAVSHCDYFSDSVLLYMASAQKLKNLKSLDFSNTYSLNEPILTSFLKVHGTQLTGLMLHGKPKLSESFWVQAISLIPKIRILTLGTPFGWFLGTLSRVHIDQIMNSLANNCPKLEQLEIQWEPDTIRYNEKSSKFVDLLRIKCSNLLSVTLADGGYYEMVRSNFDRADRKRVVRTTNRFQTSIVSQISSFTDLQFN